MNIFENSMAKNSLDIIIFSGNNENNAFNNEVTISKQGEWEKSYPFTNKYVLNVNLKLSRFLHLFPEILG